MSSTLTRTTTMYTQECCSCSVLFAVTDYFDDRRREDHRTFYCPNGHPQSYNGPSKAEREAAAEKKRAEKLERQLANAEESRRIAWAEAEQERLKHASTKGQLTKARKRAAAALCPCCNRNFVQLRRHLDAKHPEYSGEVLAGANT